MSSSRSVSSVSSVRALALSIAVSALAFGAVACGDDPTALNDPSLGDPSQNPGGTGTTDNVLSCTQAPVGKTYTGFDGQPLEASRISEGTGVNRARVKPVVAIAGEYERAIGKGSVSATNMFAAIPAIGIPDARWFEEPSLNAVSTAVLFNLAFEGCLQYTATDPAYATAPTAETGKTQCSAMERKFWQRDARPEEIDACTKYSTSVTAEKEPKRQWAYVCASVLTAAGFLSY